MGLEEKHFSYTLFIASRYFFVLALCTESELKFF